MTERMSTFFRLSLRALHSGLSVPYISCPMKRYSGLEGCGADSVCSAHPCADEHRPFRAACPNLAGHHRMLSGIRSYLSASGHPGRLQPDPASLVQRCDAVGIRRCPGVCNQYLSGQPRCDALSGYPGFTDNHAFCICYYIYSTGHIHLSSLPSENRPLKAGYVEVISSFMITIGAYLLSNISFLAPESILASVWAAVYCSCVWCLIFRHVGPDCH